MPRQRSLVWHHAARQKLGNGTHWRRTAVRGCVKVLRCVRVVSGVRGVEGCEGVRGVRGVRAWREGVRGMRA